MPPTATDVQRQRTEHPHAFSWEHADNGEHESVTRRPPPGVRAPDNGVLNVGVRKCLGDKGDAYMAGEPLGPLPPLLPPRWPPAVDGGRAPARLDWTCASVSAYRFFRLASATMSSKTSFGTPGLGEDGVRLSWSHFFCSASALFIFCAHFHTRGIVVWPGCQFPPGVASAAARPSEPRAATKASTSDGEGASPLTYMPAPVFPK